MTKFVPKEVIGDSTFVSVYDPESGDTGYVRMGDLVNKSETTVTATTGPGGVVRNSLGDVIWKPGVNQLLNVQPTTVATVADRAGDPRYSSTTNNGGGASIVDKERTDPCTGLPTLKLTCPAGADNQYQNVTWTYLPPIEMGDNDVWLVSVYCPPRGTSATVNIVLCPTDTYTGASYRRMKCPTTHGARLAPGWNIIALLNHEVRINSSTYEMLGTNQYADWEDVGTANKAQQTRCIHIQVGMISAPASATDFWVGSVHRAPAGWCKSAIMWGADDIPNGWAEYGVPIIESYGWRSTLNPSSAYTDPLYTPYMNLDVIRTLSNRGHEVWGHARIHDNIQEAADKVTPLKAARDFWAGQGFGVASQFMSWPFGAYDDEAIAAAKSLGYRAARATVGAGTAWIPALNPYQLPCWTFEGTTNPWQSDAQINGMILRGQSVMAIGHNTIPGGAGLNSRPAEVQHYADHLRRWCDLVKSHEEAGRCVVVTPSEFFNLCGLDMHTATFVE